MSSIWIDPDTLWNTATPADSILVFIYDKETKKLFSEIGDETHTDLISSNKPYFNSICQMDESDDEESFWHDYSYREMLENTLRNRLVFGRSGYDPGTQAYIYSFWKDYPDSLVNETISKIRSTYTYTQAKRNLISRPSGTIPLGQNKMILSKDEEDKANNISRDKLLAHLMPATQKKEELFKAGAKPKGINPWRKEALELAKGYNEPWRLTSESINRKHNK